MRNIQLAFLCLLLVLSSGQAEKNMSVVGTRTCPADGISTEEISKVIGCSSFYSITPSALLDLAAKNETLRNILIQKQLPSDMTAFDFQMCRSIDKKSQKCVYEKSTLFLLKDPWPYLDGGSTEVSLPVCGTGYGDSKCDSYKYLTSSCGNVTSIRTEPTEDNEFEYIYYRKKKCEWIISVDEEYAIELTFDYFRIQECLKSCECDYVKIYDIVNETDVERGTFCGVYSKWTFISHTNKLKLSYQLHGFEVGTGFSATYRTIPSNRIQILSDVKHVYGLNGKLKLIDSKPTKKVEQEYFYEWILRTEESRQIQLQWEVVKACSSGVKLVLYDGPGNDHTILTNITTTDALNGNTESSGFQIRIEVTMSKNCSGNFQATYSSQLALVSNEDNRKENVTFYSLNIPENTTTKLNTATTLGMKNVFKGYVLTVPDGLYVALNISKFIFEASHMDDCSQEGMVLWDGPPDQGTKYGPYCGNHISLLFFSVPFRKRRGIESKQTPIIHSSSNVFTVLFYWYSSPNAKPAELEVISQVSACIGITNDWLNLQYNFLNVTYTTKRDTTMITMVPAPESCFVLQSLPTKIPVKEQISIDLQPNGALNKESNLIRSDPHLGNCGGYVSLSSYNDHRIKINRKMDCIISPLGFVVKITNKKPVFQSCVKEKLRSEYQKTTSKAYKDALCGNLIYHEPTNYRITFYAPIDKYENHHFLFKFYAYDLNMPVVCYIKVIEYYNTRDWMSIPTLTTSQLPFYWKSTWAFDVSLSLKFDSPYVSMQMDYQLVPDAYPLSDPSVLCSQNHSTNIYGYNGYCYEVVPFKDADKPTWKDAEQACADNGGSLLTIHKADELEYIKGLFKHNYAEVLDDRGKVYYIGLVTDDKDNRWVDGNPAVVTDWYQRLPSETQALPARFFGDEVNFAAPTLSQPVNDRSTRCTAMVLTTPSMSTNWIKIPCQYRYEKAGYICKYNATDYAIPTIKTHNTTRDTKVVLDGNTTVLYGGTIQCPDNWVYFKHKCYRLLSSTKPINTPFNCANASQTCTDYGGDLAVVTENVFSDFEYLLGLWKHKSGYGGIWVSGCSSIQVDNTDKHIFTKGLALVTNSSDSEKILNVLCETDPTDKIYKCKNDQFKCQDGTCILRSHVCDGKQDCIQGDDEVNCTCSDSDFLCEDGSYIPMSKYCDFISDCNDNSDEKNCTHSTCLPGQSQCDNGQCLASGKFGDKIADCFDGSDEKEAESENACDAFTCYNGDCIPAEFVNNYRSDCEGNSQEDEAFVETEIKRGSWYTSGWQTLENFEPYCPKGNGSHVRCREDKSYCFPRHKACVYETDKYGYMAGCSDGSHLLGCQDFQCPSMFKCPQSYCIPLHKVCDGVVDCTGAADEENCQILSCPGLFKCRNEGYCIDQNLVCDGIYHCTDSHDDEAFCNINCPLGCTCDGYSVNCSVTDYYQIPSFTPETRSLIMSGSRIEFSNSTLLPYKYLGHLKLDNNMISYIPNGTFSFLINLLTLDLRHNKIEYLSSGMFHGLMNLQHLKLDGNPVQSVYQSAFAGLTSVQYLLLTDLRIHILDIKAFAEMPHLTDLSLANNSIEQLNSSVFTGATGMKNLNLKGNVISNLALETFDAMELQELNTDDFKFCCFAKHVPVCTPTGDAFSSCEDLMANGVLQIAIWVLGFSALVGNIFIIIWRAVTQGKKTDSLLIINLGLSDLLMGVYLIIIASADQFYRGKYILYADDWKESNLCKFAGFLSTVSSQMSVFTLVVITADRLVNIVFPFSDTKLSFRKAGIVCLFGWVVFTIFCFLPVINLPYFGKTFIKHGVCLLFNVSAGKSPGWEYITFLFLLFNLIAFTFIFVSYVVIYSHINKTRQQSKREASSADIALAKRFILIVITDFICWIPLIVTAFLALGGTPVNPQVSTWMAVFILPINSAINPYLYTLSAIGQMRERANKKKQSNASKTTKSSSFKSSDIGSIRNNKTENNI